MSMSDIADIKIDVDAHLWGWGSKGLLDLVGEVMSQKERRLMVYYRPQYWHLY
jgi:hypothetical protein